MNKIAFYAAGLWTVPSFLFMAYQPSWLFAVTFGTAMTLMAFVLWLNRPGPSLEQQLREQESRIVELNNRLNAIQAKLTFGGR